MEKNQDELTHVITESLTIINASRVQISENRITINDLTTKLAKLDEKLMNITDEIHAKLERFESFVSTHFSIDRVLTELHAIITRMTVYLEHLALQLNMLSLGRLTPSTLTPNNLQNILIKIGQNLQPPLKLPQDPRTNLWSYYQHLKCSTIIEENRILVVVPIPLLDMVESFEIFKVINIPFPSMSAAEMGAQITAQYKLESEAIAVDTGRSKIILLNENESNECKNPILGFCSVNGPIFPLNINKFCVTSLFKNNSVEIKNHCDTMMKLNTILPTAVYISNGAWAVSTHKEITFNILCEGRMSGRVVIKPPLDVIALRMGCMGASDVLTLPPYYKGENMFNVNDSYLNFLRKYSLSNITLWKPLERELIRDDIDLPKLLPDVPQADILPLVKRLEKIRKNKLISGWSLWKKIVTVGVIVSMVVIIGALLVAMIKYGWLAKMSFIFTICKRNVNKENVQATVVGEMKHLRALVASGTSSTAPMLEKTESEAKTETEQSLKMYPPLNYEN